MIKLLKYTQEADRVVLHFEKNQFVNFYKFGKDIFTETSDYISKSAVKEIKQKLKKDGLKANLDEFLNKEFPEYFENSLAQ